MLLSNSPLIINAFPYSKLVKHILKAGSIIYVLEVRNYEFTHVWLSMGISIPLHQQLQKFHQIDFHHCKAGYCTPSSFSSDWVLEWL